MVRTTSKSIFGGNGGGIGGGGGGGFIFLFFGIVIVWGVMAGFGVAKRSKMW